MRPLVTPADAWRTGGGAAAAAAAPGAPALLGRLSPGQPLALLGG